MGRVCLGLILSLITSMAGADVLRVATPGALQEALREATPGTEITLAPGDYGTLDLRGFDAGGEVILRSAKQDNPARFSAMKLQQVQGLRLVHLMFDYEFSAGDPVRLRPFEIRGSADVRIEAALFDGDLAQGLGPAADGFPTAFGLRVQDSHHISLKQSEIRGFMRGLVMRNTAHIEISGNDVHSIRSDGMNFAQVQDVHIIGNHIHDFDRSLASDDHADMIQIWTQFTTAPSRGIVIRDNILNSGEGLFTQSIFMRNEMVDQGQAGPEMFYEDVTIENNLVINAHLNGIVVGEVRGLRLRNNTVVRNARSEGPRDVPLLYTPQIRVAEAAQDVEIARNVTHRIAGHQDQPDWDVTGNVFVQDSARGQPGFYGRVFGPKALRDPTTPDAFVPLADGPLAGMGAGARW